MISCLQSPLFSVMNSSSFLKNPENYLCKFGKDLSFSKGMRIGCGGESKRRGKVVVCGGWLLPVDPWAPTIDSESIASQLFAASLFPYLGFLYFITKSKSAPKLTLFGFYFLLAFVGATTKVHYGTSLSNVDWLHGGAESLLTLTNLFIVLGLRQALRGTRDTANEKSSPAPHFMQSWLFVLLVWSFIAYYSAMSISHQVFARGGRMDIPSPC